MSLDKLLLKEALYSGGILVNLFCCGNNCNVPSVLPLYLSVFADIRSASDSVQHC